MGKGRRNREIRKLAARELHMWHPAGQNERTVKSLARRLRRVGRMH
jgi:hypothetical protein